MAALMAEPATPVISPKKINRQSKRRMDTHETMVSQNVEETAVAQTLVDQFKATLSEKDMKILKMRMNGYTLDEISEKLGCKNHSGVLKRIRKIG